MTKRLTALCAAAVLGMFGAMALASPAQAHHGHEPVAPWEVRDNVGGTWGAPAESQILSEDEVPLSKPDGATGTSVETTNLGLTVDSDTILTVSYVGDGDVSYGAGAVRMFYYSFADADTNAQAPTATVVADGSGTLSIPIPASTTIGTMGLTYDASNDSAGTVTFTSLMVGEELILFQNHPRADPVKPIGVDGTCEERTGGLELVPVDGVKYEYHSTFKWYGGKLYRVFKVKAVIQEGYVLAEGADTEWTIKVKVKKYGCETTSPDPTTDPTTDPTVDPTTDPTTGPTTDPTTGPTGFPTPTPTETTSPPVVGTGGGGDKPGLPLTGPALLRLAGAGVLLGSLGGIALFLARRTRPQVTDETVEIPL